MLFKNKQLQRALTKNDVISAKNCIRSGAVCDKKWLSVFLLTAIKGNDIQAIRTYAESKLDLEFTLDDVSQVSMLYMAGCEGNLSIIQYLISKGAKVDIYTEQNRPLLQDVCRNKDPIAIEIVKLLVKNGIDINFQDIAFKKSALMIAARYNNRPLTKALIDLNANVDLIDTNGETAWMMAGENTKDLFPNYQIEQKKEQNIKKNGLWSPCFARSIACTQTSEEINLELKEVFNFATKEVTTIIRNTKTNSESHSKELFNQYMNKDRLETACLEYNKLHDILDDFVNVDNILKTKIFKTQNTELHHVSY